MPMGEPGEQICTFADENNVDFIIIGSHTRSVFQKFVLKTTK